MTWFCAYTNSQSEGLANHFLQQAGYETLYLRHSAQISHAGRKTTKILPVYPRYLFLAVGPSQGLYRASKCQGVCKVVTFGEGPAEIPLEIIERERRRVGRDGLVELTPEEKQLRKRLRKGDRIKIQYGNLTGYQGTVIIDSGRIIRLEVEGKRVSALPEQLSPAGAAR